MCNHGFNCVEITFCRAYLGPMAVDLESQQQRMPWSFQSKSSISCISIIASVLSWDTGCSGFAFLNFLFHRKPVASFIFATASEED